MTQDDGRIQYDSFDYFPHHHYQEAVDGYEQLLDRINSDSPDELLAELDRHSYEDNSSNHLDIDQVYGTITDKISDDATERTE